MNTELESEPRAKVYTFKLLQRQRVALQDIQKQTGATVAELIRRSIDAYVDKHVAQQKKRSR